MPHGANSNSAAGHSVLIVDSHLDFLNDSCELIAKSGHRAWGARDLIAAASFLADQVPDLMLVELDLLEMDGADPLGDLRAQAPAVPTILMASGPPGKRFESFSRSHEIYGYHDKNHGGVGLLLWVTAASMTARHAELIRQTRQGLRQVVEAVPELHKIQSLDEVLEAILGQAAGLVGAERGFVAARSSDPVGRGPIGEDLDDAQASIDDYVVSSGSDGFPRGATVDELGSVPKQVVRRAVEDRRNIIDRRQGVLPLALGEHVLGLAYLDRPAVRDHSLELLQIFASQAAAAIRNAALYELATVDSTTRVFRKSFTLERLRETVKLGWRKEFPVTVLMLDIDQFKDLNDLHGHVVGDRALRHIGNVLKANVRDSDIVGRFGGDEFLVILIDAYMKGGKIVADRLYDVLMSRRGRRWPEGMPPLEISLGMATLDPGGGLPPGFGFLTDFDHIVETLVAEADAAMYMARREKADWMYAGRTLTWSDFKKR